MDQGVAPLIEQFIQRFGSEAKAAAAAGVSQPVVNAAKQAGRCGPKLAMGIEAATGGDISRSMLRPDLWPPAPPCAEPASPEAA